MATARPTASTATTTTTCCPTRWRSLRDGDGILDGADDQDFDGWSNLSELSRAQYRVQPFNPCLPDYDSPTCTKHPLIGSTYPPFDKPLPPSPIVTGTWRPRREGDGPLGASYPRAEMASYSFLSTWCLAAPIERVWEVLADAERYPEWWKGVRSVTVLEPGEGGADGVGTLYRLEWRSALPYSLQFDSRVTRFQPPHHFEGHASGELVGVGAWRLFDGPAGTVALYSWDVSTTRAWMNRLGPLARPAFAWNHDYVMRQGARGLADKLDVELVAHS